jgi:hypothetical protein
MTVQLHELIASLDGLESRIAAAEDDARDKNKESLGKLREEARAAAAKLDEVKAAGEASWDAAMAEMDEVWSAVKHSVNYFQSQL